MSKRKTYVVQEGDTVQDISARFLGVPALYPKILESNLYITSRPNDNVFPGDVLIIPDLDLIEPDFGEDDFTTTVKILIDGVDFPNFSEFSLELSMDRAADQFSFVSPWEPENEILKNIFIPFKYNDVKIFIGGVLKLTGTIINVIPTTSETSSLQVEGYSKCGILNDCNMPLSSYPLVYKTLTIGDISNTLVQPFNLTSIDNTVDTFVFEDVDIKPTSKVYSFLSGLCKKRGSLITSLPDGNIVIQKATTEKASFSLVQGSPNIVSITANFNGQGGYTSVSGLLKGKDTDEATADDDSFTETDKFMVAESASRPLVIEFDDIEIGALQAGVKSKLRRMLADRISYSIVLEGWRDPNGALWEDNMRVNIEYPLVMIYNITEFLVRNVELSQESDKEIAKLTLVLPQSYNDEELEGLPWLE